MRKLSLCICLVLVFNLFYTVPVAACWPAPTPFEIISEDGSRVFIYIPDSDSTDNIANASVYEIVNGERKLVYTVEGLTSSAHEWNFYFSADMTHIVRTFFPSLHENVMSAFEVFSHGVLTRVVMRYEFIQDYGFSIYLRPTSVCSPFAIDWYIDENESQGAIITLSTGEGNTFLFDLAIAEFITEDVLPVNYEAQYDFTNDMPISSNYPIENEEALGFISRIIRFVPRLFGMEVLP